CPAEPLGRFIRDMLNIREGRVRIVVKPDSGTRSEMRSDGGYVTLHVPPVVRSVNQTGGKRASAARNEVHEFSTPKPQLVANAEPLERELRRQRILAVDGNHSGSGERGGTRTPSEVSAQFQDRPSDTHLLPELTLRRREPTGHLGCDRARLRE